MLESVTPFFIVDDLAATLDFYQSKLGFAILHKGGGDQPTEDFWAIVIRDRVMLMFKEMCIRDRWMTENGYTIVGPVREVYLHMSKPVRQDDESYVTEIQVPVRKE